MGSCTRDNPPPGYPGRANCSPSPLHEDTNSSQRGWTSWGRGGGGLSHLGRSGNPGRREKFFSCETLWLTFRDYFCCRLLCNVWVKRSVKLFLRESCLGYPSHINGTSVITAWNSKKTDHNDVTQWL